MYRTRALGWDGQEGSCRKLWREGGWCGLRHVPPCDGTGEGALTSFGLFVVFGVKIIVIAIEGSVIGIEATVIAIEVSVIGIEVTV